MTTTRVLRLLSLLQSRREWAGGELADQLGVTGRTVRRDVARLRELGYPIEATTGTAGGYRLASGSNLPPLLLDDDEAVAVAVGLLTAARAGVSGVDETAPRALAKLQQVLPARLAQRIAAVGDVTVRLRPGRGSRVDPTTLAVLAAACRDREMVTFDHRRRDGVSGERRVEPYQLLTGYGLWYLLAFDTGRRDWRTFRVDRIAGPTPIRLRFSPRPLPAEDTTAFLASAIREAPYRYTALATVQAPADVVTARLPDPMPDRVQALDPRTCTVLLRGDSLDVLVQDLVALGADFTLDGPAELLDHLHMLGKRLQDAGPDQKSR
ncbi:helix-turn-helix transcriptional regulator [Pseudonocardia alaniniphila]|uniref:WYL domain-containing protein n=1 Tax=Pseudonocardia alaniniphila TaxID=75291 RepID=A0ABS9TPY2_9PSEU|nr:WYL domain-containing protein [Pseudonocardia alaniniphila]MCH6170602.1 WYL domain-containing protein [Pseudonocardia alaniniphila]